MTNDIGTSAQNWVWKMRELVEETQEATQKHTEIGFLSELDFADG